MNKLQQQAPQTTNSASPPPLNLVSTEQIQKYLDENKNLIMAILENQNLGKMAECAQYQAVLQKNLMYLAAIADAQPQGSSPPSQLPISSVAPQGNTPVPQPQTSTMQQQPNVPIGKSPFQVNALRPQDQQNQLPHFQQQQQLQPHFAGGPNGSVQMFMQPGLGNSSSLMDFRGNQQGMLDASSGDGRGNSGLGPAEGRG